MQTLKVREKKVSVHTYNYDNIIEFLNITKDILENPTVKQMKNFRQHYDCSCYKHCLEVAYWSYLFCKKYSRSRPADKNAYQYADSIQYANSSQRQ